MKCRKAYCKNIQIFLDHALLKWQDKFLLEPDRVDTEKRYWVEKKKLTPQGNPGAICTVVIKSQLYDISFSSKQKNNPQKWGVFKNSDITHTMWVCDMSILRCQWLLITVCATVYDMCHCNLHLIIPLSSYLYLEYTPSNQVVLRLT